MDSIWIRGIARIVLAVSAITTFNYAAEPAMKTGQRPSSENNRVPGVYNVLEFGASGSAVTTTGNIAAASNTLTVASAATFAEGQGILIKGAGAKGAHHVATITVIKDASITLSAEALSNVTNAVVQHDDTAAINAALAAAYQGGGGQVLLPSGRYRCNAPFNRATNSILTLPQNIAYVGLPTRIEFIGTVRSNDPGPSADPAKPAASPGGVSIDASDAPAGSGTDPAVFAGSPTYVEGFTQWQNADVFIDKMSFFVPPNPTICGVNFSNCLRGSVGDSFVAFASDPTVRPTNASVGIIFPQAHNNVIFHCGEAHIAGFKTGIRASEHLLLKGPYIGLCETALDVTNPCAYPLHLISGSLCIESCPTMIRKTGPGNQAVNLSLKAEVSFPNQKADAFHAVGAHWWDGAPGQDVVDSGNTLYGKIEYTCISNATGAALSLGVAGGAHASFVNLYGPR